ncbi:MAG: type II secretion system protein [Candidatus Paceibacterota bacterium]
MKKNNLQKGFTLIELLMVVSIIALLSSVVVAGLTDARGGAKNNKRNELARQYVTAFGLYHGEYGYYPKQYTDDTADNMDLICLGSGYPTLPGGGNCYVEGPHSQNTNVNTAISEFAPGTPPSLEKTVVAGQEYFGISYRCLDDACTQYELNWIVEGSGSSANCFGGATKIELGNIGLCTYDTTGS